MLIKCPECSNLISEKALSCPHCGFPMAEYINREIEKSKKQEELKEIEEQQLKIRDDSIVKNINNAIFTDLYGFEYAVEYWRYGFSEERIWYKIVTNFVLDDDKLHVMITEYRHSLFPNGKFLSKKILKDYLVSHIDSKGILYDEKNNAIKYYDIKDTMIGQTKVKKPYFKVMIFNGINQNHQLIINDNYFKFDERIPKYSEFCKIFNYKGKRKRKIYFWKK